MEAKKLRAEILRLVAEHEATGSNVFLSDKRLAEALGVDRQDVQKQMLILGESLGLLNLSKTMGPDYGARLTSDGMLAVEEQQDAEQQRSQTDMAHPSSIKLFISHSSADADLAGRVADLMRAALNLPASAIRCTSVDAYRLPGGADTNEQLRREVHESVSFIGIVSNRSVQSMYVLFELGARWGAGRSLLPLLAPGSPITLLGGPLAVLNAHQASNRAHLHQLLADVARELKLTPEASSTYQQQIENILQLAPLAVAQPAAGPRSSTADESSPNVGGEHSWMA